MWRSFNPQIQIIFYNFICALRFPTLIQFIKFQFTSVMDSNSICFGMNLSSMISVKSPSMLDESKFFKSKSTDESTNFMDFQQFNKASIGSCETLDCDHESVSQSFQQPKKTKIIQKQKHPKKQVQKQIQREESQKFNIILAQRAVNEKPHIQNVNNNQNAQRKPIQKKPVNTKSHSFASIFDWMMQIASIMRLSRSVFYRACNIFYESYKRNSKVLENSNVQKYVCASLNISAKLEASNIDFLEELYHVNRKRIEKQAITEVEVGIYQILEWKLPLLNLVSEQVIEVFDKWDQYIEKCERMGLIGKETKERLSLRNYSSQQKALKSKIQGQILYLLDIMLLNESKKHMSASSIIPTTSKQFYTPIVIAIYSVLTIHHGDPQNKEKFFLPLFRNFYRQGLQMPAPQIDRLSKDIQLSFMIFGFEEHLKKIPLDKDWKDVLDKDLLVYLPINVLAKTKK